MYVKFGTLELAGGTGRTMPNSLKLGGTAVTQDAARLRAAAIKLYARKNWKTTISFGVSREHRDLKAAELFLFTHMAALAAEGRALAQFRFGEGNGQHFYLVGAVIVDVSENMTGVRTQHTYTIAGGIPSSNSQEINP